MNVNLIRRKNGVVFSDLRMGDVFYPESDDGEYDTNDFAYHLFESYYYRHLVAAFYLTVLVSPALKCSFFCLPL